MDGYYTMRLSPSSVAVRAGHRTRITVSFRAATGLFGTEHPDRGRVRRSGSRTHRPGACNAAGSPPPAPGDPHRAIGWFSRMASYLDKTRIPKGPTLASEVAAGR